MGRLLATGAGAGGHGVGLARDDEGVLLSCSCGWRTRLSAGGPWAIHEAQHVYEAHVAGSERPSEL